MNNECYFENKETTVIEFFDFVKKIRSKDNITNSVFTFNSLKEVVENNKGKIFIGKDAAIILCKDINNIYRLTFYIKNRVAIKEVFNLVPKLDANIICDLIGKKNVIEKDKNLLESINFKLYAVFQRMVCRKIIVDESLDLRSVELAKEDDVIEILAITYDVFDPLTARIHSEKELVDLIKNQEVFVVRVGEKIAGFAIFNSIGKKVALLDHIIVRKEYRHKQIANKILYYKWKYKNASEIYYLWVNEKCDGAIKYHAGNGFKTDGIYDYIFVLNNLRSDNHALKR